MKNVWTFPGSTPWEFLEILINVKGNKEESENRFGYSTSNFYSRNIPAVLLQRHDDVTQHARGKVCRRTEASVVPRLPVVITLYGYCNNKLYLYQVGVWQLATILSLEPTCCFTNTATLVSEISFPAITVYLPRSVNESYNCLGSYDRCIYYLVITTKSL